MAAPLLKLAATELAPQLPEHGGRIAAALLLALIAAPAILLLLATGVSGNQCGALSSASAEPSPHAKRAIPRWLIPVYTEAARKFRLGREGWAYLAAVDLVENGYEGERGSQTPYANAQGPMQFLPATWARYGKGGDINSNRDAIFGAARLLAANGAPGNMSNALYRYNPTPRYVKAVTAYATEMQGDERAYFGYYHWQVYYRMVDGDRLLPVGYGA